MIAPILGDEESYNNILTNDFMYPAWDISKKRPLFFSESVAEHEISLNVNSVYSMSYSNMILASASNPTYFQSSKIKHGTTEP
jgi:hypothetical protein